MQQFEKIKDNRNFRRLYHRGKSYVAPSFVLYTGKGAKDKVRLGITVTKKIGSAVKRNRAKRVITAAFRAVAADIVSGNDFVIVARTRILETKSDAVADILRKQLKSAALINENETDK